MLSKLSKQCPTCNKSRETYYTIEKDPKMKGRSWRIERCPKCGFNFEIEEVTGREHRYKKDEDEGGGMFGRARGGWLA